MFSRLLCIAALLPVLADAMPIDRHALVTPHNPTITVVNRSAPFMVGNGNLAFTADITGLHETRVSEPRSSVVRCGARTSAGWGADRETMRRTLDAVYGSLLLAVALMVAGGSDVHELNPGFPPKGLWVVHSEGILPLP